MWYIKYKQEDENVVVDKLFNSKRDAYIYSRSSLKGVDMDSVDILNIDTNISVPGFKEGSKLYFKSVRNGELYGYVDKIHNYLINIRQGSNDIELSKARINKEYINGNLTIHN